MRQIKNLLRLNENIEIEAKIFSIFLFISLWVSYIFILISFFVYEVFHPLILIQGFSILVFSLIAFQIYYNKKYSALYSDIFLLFLMIEIDIIYFMTDGIFGASSLMLTILASLGLLLQNTKSRKYIFILLQTLNFFFLYFISKQFPSLVKSYGNQLEREADFLSSAFLSIVASMFLLKFFKDSYDLDRKQMIEKTKALKALNHELEVSNFTITELAMVKSNFLATMSHEIRTPLNGIIGMTELYQLSDTDEDKSAAIQTIESSSKLLLSIVNDILDFSKVEAGKLKLDENSFDLRKCLDEVIKTFSRNPKILYKEIVIQLAFDSSLENRYIGDELRLKQILLNLIANSVKFTESGEIKILVTKQNSTDNSNEVLFKIIDSGIGIEKPELLFQAFTQADSSITRKFGGTGLGLTISKSLINLMGGQINVISKLGSGSIFYFSINLLLDNKTPKGNYPVVIEKTNLNNQGLKILLVEDNLVNQLVFIKFMKKLNYLIDSVSNGKLAVEKIQENTYDLIFMDMEMPELDGVEATRRIRALNLSFQPKIIALTANVMEDAKQVCSDAGMNDFLTKPYSLEQIKASIERNSRR